MKWEEFVANVQQWSKDRGIYEHSTAVAQALKACSEAGELCDAVVKGDREALIDAVGDVAVCLVNAAELSMNQPIALDCELEDSISLEQAAACVSLMCGMAANRIACGKEADDDIALAMHTLQDFCEIACLDFMHCCESAWDEIKDRKGRMVPGGAFVKE